MSRSFDGGFMTFVLPLIVDGIFHKAMPWLFAPNSIQLLQTEEFSFSQVMWRKRRDRVLQAAAIGGLLAALAAAAAALARMAWASFGREMWRALAARVGGGLA
mmetsp:Transcript_4145/g.13102  ORF Transcript_4145/g.13102 Transcript_4145/m.13102 type:complete len:103 (+) Transcript_4145:1696-2004(+)